MIAVIGTSPAGLAAARDLVRAGHEVVVLDAADRLGGWAATIEVDGLRVGLGDDALDPDLDGASRARVESLVSFATRSRDERLLVGDRWVAYPPTVVRSMLGRTSPRAVAAAERALWSKLHGVDSDALPIPASALSEASGRSRLRPRGGLAAVVEALATDLPELRLGTKVTGLVEHDDRVIVGLGDGRIITASAVLAAVSAERTAAWLGLVDTGLAPSRAMVLVHLVVAGRPWTSTAVHHLPSPLVLPVRVTDAARLSDELGDPADRTVVCAHVPCWTDDSVWHARDDRLAQRVVDDLVRVGLPDPHVLSVRVTRLAGAVPDVTTSGRARAARAERVLRSPRRVRVIGRGGLPLPSLGPDLVRGWAAAAAVRPDGTLGPGVSGR